MERAVALARKSSAEQIKAIHEGLPVATFQSLANYLGISQGELAGSLRIQPRTLRNRPSSGRLNAQESEKSLRVARVIAKGCDVLGNQAKATKWMFSNIKSLGDKRPIDLLETDIGAGDVLNVLAAIEWGVYL